VERHGRGMGTACYMCESAFILPPLFHSHIQSCTNGATKYNVDSDGFRQ